MSGDVGTSGAGARVRVLGPVAVSVGGADLTIPSGKPLSALAMLAIEGGRPVAAARLVAGLWGEEAPLSAAQTLQVHISTLRRHLRDHGIGVALDPGGYRLTVAPDDIDLVRFERAADDGLAALHAGRPEVARELLRSALEEWAGDPLADVLDAPFAAHEADRLALRRLAALQARLDADLALGLGTTLVDETRAVLADHPYDERACRQFVLSTYRAGQPADALGAITSFRARLADDLGLDPGPDLAELEYQILVHDDRLLAHAPAPPGPTHNLPADVSSFIGRRRELGEVRAAADAARLVTLTGAGGVGKTRLALAAASSLLDDLDRAWLAELAPLADPGSLAAAVAAAVGAAPDEGVDGLVAALSDRSALLVLDNCEHLVDDVAGLVVLLLQRCPQLRVLATSREPLGVTGERIYRVPPLGLERSGSDGSRRSDAVALFAERAALQRSDFVLDTTTEALVSDICGRLDGLPLAIELVAARTSSLPLDELARRLDARSDLLSGRARRSIPRQQTIRALIDWSYDLLGPQEQLMLDAVSVFSSGFTLDAVERVAGGAGLDDAVELVTALVDKSLVELTGGDVHRYRLLEMIRAYAAERLGRRDDDLVARLRLAHAHHYLGLAERAAPDLERGRHEAEWLERLGVEHGNLRSASSTFLAAGQAAAGLRLAVSLRLFWDIRGHYAEGASITRAHLEQASPGVDPHVSGMALCAFAEFHERLGDIDRMTAAAGEAIELAHATGDRDLAVAATLVAANADDRRGEPDRARERLAAVDTAGVDPNLAERVVYATAYALLGCEDWANARAALERCARAAEANGDVRRHAITLVNLACVDMEQGELAAARRRLVAAHQCAAPLRDPALGAAIDLNLGFLEVVDGEITAAHIRFRESLLMCQSSGVWSVAQGVVLGFALCAGPDDTETSVTLHGFVARQLDELDTGLGSVEKQLRLADLDRRRADLDDAVFRDLFERGRTLDLPEAIDRARSIRPHEVTRRRHSA